MGGARGRGFRDFIKHIHPPKVANSTAGVLPTLCVGGLSFFFFLLLLVTGLLLMLFYQPGSPAAAYDSLTVIQDVVAFGWFVRSVHKWAGQAMVFTVILHLVRVVVTGAYRPPREFNWVIGVLLLLFTVLLDFTGYLLIGDATARHALKVAHALAGEVPLAGFALQLVLFGGPPDADLAGVRVYLWHCMLLPLLVAVFSFWHFYRVRKDGGVKWPL